MTSLAFLPDSTSYSIRACRCGDRMRLGRVGPAPVASWHCGGCGRKARR